MKKVKIEKASTTRPKKNGEAVKAVKPHHQSKVHGKPKKATNMPRNYGVKNG